MALSIRLKFASRAAGLHLLSSLAVAVLASVLVFGLWYPYPYQELAGGRELFLLVVAVDIVSGPLLTLVLFTPAKRRAELASDLLLVVGFQLLALGYGLSTVWQARPLFLVAEVDRFKVVSASALRAADLALLPAALQPKLWDGPRLVATRVPDDPKEQLEIIEGALGGGPDLGERPKYYSNYDSQAAIKMLGRAKPLESFVQKYPDQRGKAESIAGKAGMKPGSIRYLPVVSRQEWIALLNNKGGVVGFLKGDGF